MLDIMLRMKRDVCYYINSHVKQEVVFGYLLSFSICFNTFVYRLLDSLVV